MNRTRTVALGIAAVLAVSANACGSGTSSQPGQHLLDLINEKRAAVHCPAVTGDDQLRAAADRHAVDMRDHPSVRTDPMHIGSDGSTVDQRIAAAGFTPVSRIGEVMYSAIGPPKNTAEANVDWWMNSPPHKAIIETCAFTHAGVGLLYPGGKDWFSTVDFASH
jgi:uncharacterized protein YkwD